MDPYTDSCQAAADAMSCAAMTMLAKAHARDNAHQNAFRLDDPAYKRYCEYPNRVIEDELQKTIGSSKKMCFNRLPTYQDGPWKDQFAPLIPPGPTIQDIRYETQTRARNPVSM